MVRKLFGMMVILSVAMVLAACGGEDEEDTPAEVATEPAENGVVTEEPTIEIATEIADVEDATPTEEGIPASIASPNVATPPSTAASPAATSMPAAASPVAQASPGAAVATPGSGSDQSEEAGTMLTLSGTVLLPGEVNQAYILTDTGCVGLGGYSDIRAGRQLIFRNESGEIIGVTTLEASDATDMCSWTFSLEVPQSEFYAVSIPMVFEYIFTDQDIDDQDGKISLPLR